MPRLVHGRFWPLLASLLLIGGLLGVAPGGVAAAQKASTRQLYVGTGTPNLGNCSPYCPLALTGVTAGANAHSFADVIVANLGGNTLNNVTVSGGATATAAPKNNNFDHPADPSLPSGWTVAQVRIDTTTPTLNCSIPSDSLSFTCNIVGSLLTGQFVKFRLVLTVPTAPTNPNVWLMASVNESSSKGKNQDSFFALGAPDVSTPNCLKNENYVLPTELISLSTPNTCTQPTTITGAPGANGSQVSVGIDTTNKPCPDALVEAETPCQGDLSVANVDNGLTGPVEWTITFNFVPTFVIHFHADYDPSDPGTYDLILLSDPPCATASAVNCWISKTPGPAPVTVVFRTATNTSARGG
jgi:hypothetical protein